MVSSCLRREAGRPNARLIRQLPRGAVRLRREEAVEQSPGRRMPRPSTLKRGPRDRQHDLLNGVPTWCDCGGAYHTVKSMRRAEVRFFCAYVRNRTEKSPPRQIRRWELLQPGA